VIVSASRTNWSSDIGSVAAVCCCDVLAAGDGCVSDRCGDYAEQHTLLSNDLTAALRSTAKRYRITMSTLVLGAWALWLSRRTEQSRVVFGVTLSGRPVELAQMESMVGPFINNLPMWVHVDKHTSFLRWLRQLMQQRAEMELHAHVPLGLLRQCIGAPQDKPLFESTYRFQNYPFSETLLNRTQCQLAITTGRIIDRWHYPLNLVVTPGSELSLRITYDRNQIDDDTSAETLIELQDLLACCVRDPQQPLKALVMSPLAKSRRLD
jgi:non-ribosomal peptide synthetase component F